MAKKQELSIAGLAPSPPSSNPVIRAVEEARDEVIAEFLERDRLRADPIQPPAWSLAPLYLRAGFRAVAPRSADGRGDAAAELLWRHRAGLTGRPTPPEVADVERWALGNAVIPPDGTSDRVAALESARMDAILGHIRDGKGWCGGGLILESGGHVWGLACHPARRPTAADLAEIGWFAGRAGLLRAVGVIFSGDPRPRIIFLVAGSPEAEEAFRRVAAGGFEPVGF